MEMHHGDVLVGTAMATELAMDTPPAPTLAQAREASKRYVCYENHSFPTCFVCGPGRPEQDGLQEFIVGDSKAPPISFSTLGNGC